MKPLIISIALSLVLVTPCLAQTTEAHRIIVRDTVYLVASVKTVYRTKINRLNALRLKRGAERIEFNQVDSPYTLTVNKSDVPNKILKDIPDPRPFAVKHPVIYSVSTTGVNVACTLFSLFAK